MTILDVQEIENRGFHQRRLMNWFFDFRDDQIIILIDAVQEETRQFIRGQFIFQNNGKDWELISQTKRKGL
jgi:hypothetical protein